MRRCAAFNSCRSPLLTWRNSRSSRGGGASRFPDVPRRAPAGASGALQTALFDAGSSPLSLARGTLAATAATASFGWFAEGVGVSVPALSLFLGPSAAPVQRVVGPEADPIHGSGVLPTTGSTQGTAGGVTGTGMLCSSGMPGVVADDSDGMDRTCHRRAQDAEVEGARPSSMTALDRLE